MHSHACLRLGTVIAILAGAATLTARADEVISIRGGTFVFENGDGVLDIFGTQGFKFTGGANITGGFFEAYSQCQLPECPPGTTVNLNAGWGGNDLTGAARLRGTVYEDVGGLASDSSAGVGFSGSVTMPPMSDGPVSITVPFDFSGFFAFGLNGDNPQRLLLTGGGRVTLTLVQNPYDNTTWMIQRAEFQFTPVEAR